MTASRAPLTRDSLRLKITVQRVRMDGTDFRVVSPAKPLKNGAFYRSRRSLDLYVDRPDGHRIGTLFLLAARSPRTLVHLPMRTTATAPGVGWEDEKPLDLVLAHRAVQFRPTRWKKLRERLTAGNAPRETRTASVPESDLQAGHASGRAPWSDPDSSGLRQDEFAETLFLTGTTPALREAARQVFAVTEEGPPAAASGLYIAGGCNYHVCRGLFTWEELQAGGWDELHIEFSPPWAK
ncbi:MULTISPECIES: hypothetical protein [unclassified Streptomyces]|uniref:hypothetical protein n=1 Tax=unclassified Streptomyces TaxID=2593676 RepID=UPI003663A34D